MRAFGSSCLEIWLDFPSQPKMGRETQQIADWDKLIYFFKPFQFKNSDIAVARAFPSRYGHRIIVEPTTIKLQTLKPVQLSSSTV